MDVSEDKIQLDDGLQISKVLQNKLYPHQRAGIRWLFDLYATGRRGGILADDMGGEKFLQIDGTVMPYEARERMIEAFQDESSISVLLLTTQVGGVGLNLTAADRVIIYDPSWNPATDAQAIDRAFRIGQKNTVIVYRLVTCGTVEEKIYRRQIMKEGIRRKIIPETSEDSMPFSYFSEKDLGEIFKYEYPDKSVTQSYLEKIHGDQFDDDLTDHLMFLQGINYVSSLSDHSKIFKLSPITTFETVAAHFIKQKEACSSNTLRITECRGVSGAHQALPYQPVHLQGISSSQAIMEPGPSQQTAIQAEGGATLQSLQNIAAVFSQQKRLIKYEDKEEEKCKRKKIG